MTRSPAYPLTLLFWVMPAASVLQFRAIAPLGLAALLATVLLAWRAEGRPPWPRGPILWVALALSGWGAVSALWALDAQRSLTDALTLGAFVALGVAGAGVVARSEAAAQRRLLRALAVGLGIGVILAAADHASGNLLRAAVRGIRDPQPTLGFGLKPAVTVIAVLLPLAMGAPVARGLRLALAVAAVATALWLPAETAKIAILAGLVTWGAALLLPRLARYGAAVALAVLVLATPVALDVARESGAAASRLPFSAAHRAVIWDFALARIAERPVLGWGYESSRAMPGGQAMASPATLDRLGIAAPALRARFALPNAQSMPLHPHNGPLQLRLELGWVGAVLGAVLLALLALAARTPGALGALVAAVVVGSLSYGLWQGWWIALLLVVAAASRALAGQDAEHVALGGAPEQVALVPERVEE